MSMGKFGLKKKRLLATGVAVLALLIMAMPVFAASWRVQSYVYGQSYLNGQTILTDALGYEIYNISGSQWLDSEYGYTTTANDSVSFNRSFRQGGQPQDGSQNTADWMGYASTGYGKNKLSVGMTGNLTNQTYNEITTNPVTGNTMELSISESKYVYGYSIWEELFLITPKNKNLIGTEASVTLHIRLNGSLDGDASSFSYNLSNFDWSSVASDSAYGTATINETLTGTFTFKYGDPLYLQSQLSAQLSGIGIVDMSHTAEITGIDIPDGAKIKFLSGASSSSYGTLVGGDGYGEYGTGQTVPIPSALWLMGTGLIGLVGLSRRKQ